MRFEPIPFRLLAWAVVGLLSTVDPASPTEAGVVVERVEAGSPAAAAGLRGGDRLVGWSQGTEGGAFSSSLDLALVGVERAPLGPVVLRGVREGAPLEASLAPDEWGIVVAGSPDPSPSTGESPEREALALRLEAGRLLEADRPEDAAVLIARAVGRLRPSPGGLSLAAALADQGRVSDASGRDLDEGERAAAESVALYATLAPQSLAYARALEVQARHAAGRQAAIQILRNALALAERLAPDGPAVADILDALAFYSNELEVGRRALAIREQLAPESAGFAASLAAQAARVVDQGDLKEGEAMARRAVAMLERVRPRGLSHARALASLGTILSQKGDLAGSEQADRAALAIDEALAPGSLNVAKRLNNLAALNRLQLDLDAAEAGLLRAVAILEKEDARGDLMARCYTSLGNVAGDRGDPAGALVYYDRALELLTVVDASSYGVAYLGERKGLAYEAQGLLDRAEASYAAALAVAERRYPRSTSTADKHYLLGALALRRGRLDAAAEQLAEALRLREELAPGTLGEAEARNALGRLALARGRKDDALELFRRAVESLEAQGERLGGSPETRIRFRARYRVLYRDLEDLLIAQGRSADAFAVSERSRSRGLLALIASRPFQLAASVPAELEAERIRADGAYDRALGRLSGTAADSEEHAARARRLSEARAAREDVRSRLRVAAPRSATFVDPIPLDLDGTRRALEPGTLLLAYSLGTSQSRVFAVGPGPDEFAVLAIEGDAATLAREVQTFRQRIVSTRGRLGRSALHAQGARLARRLLAPAADRLRRARQLLIVPDGPIHQLPFAALPDPTRGDREYLVESHAVHTISSATLYAALTGEPRADGPDERPVIAFGDPSRATASAGGASPQARGALQPLPGARMEAEALRALAPQRAQVWLGPAATEERAKALPSRARVVHFACHGLLDAEFPLESGLALSAPSAGASQENGFLQAWEVLEQIRVDADLVTLSACETGRGQDLGGEGLLGLTWAFQYAGARTVVATLWEVGDASTARLMRRFYGALARGVPKAEALRQAQLDLLRDPATDAPFHWAAFQLIGDGR